MFKTKEEFKKEYSKRVVEMYGREISESHVTEKFLVLESLIRDYASVNWVETKHAIAKNKLKEVHYFSMEFLMGRMLTSNLMNLGIYGLVQDGLADLGIDVHQLEEIETDAGLGNGGLGRLAACFLDSLASLDYSGQGHTIRYQYGLFKQKIEDGYQVELPDNWMATGFKWEVRKPKHKKVVKFYGHIEFNEDTKKFELKDAEEVYAVPYDVPIVGAGTKTTNTLRLWNAESADRIPRGQDFSNYITNVRDICQQLYPDDSSYKGKMLRLKQEYFFTSAGVQAVVSKHLRTNESLDNFHEQHVIQLNDTHPVLAIPELMRILMDEHGYVWEDAWAITTNTFAYTNHTILSEALETWPIDMVKQLLPRVYQIIDEIHHRFNGFLQGNSYGHLADEVMILKDGYVHMARLAIVGSFSVNGVAALHTKILINQELKDFASIFKEKFNNKTNGVTHRRWLRYANGQLADLLDDTIGTDWVKHPERLEDLINHVNDPAVIDRFFEVKRARKAILAKNIRECTGVEVDIDSIFDVQVKRLHGYKRQLLNVFNIMALYFELKEDPAKKIVPRTFIFGAKAASSYHFAKNVIKLINSVGDVVNNDPHVSKFMRVVFIENYGVSKAEMIMPAADVSEQISLAGKEASGTGNMKFMMNGALTLGTLDGANVEISEQVGHENCTIFGFTSDQVSKIKANGSYQVWDYYNNDGMIKRIIDSLTDGTWSRNREEFRIVFDELMRKNDEYLVLGDFEAYRQAQRKIDRLYLDKHQWGKMMLINIAKSGYFSSDRTIEQYVEDIWHLDKLNKYY